MILEKSEFRARMRAERKRLAGTDPEAPSRLADHAKALPSGEIAAIYAPIGSEMDTDALARALIAQGRILCLPVVIQRDAAMIFRRWAPGDPLEMDTAGVPAPLPLAETVRPELVLTPLLAFDGAGGRLGQGGGFYDRTFAALPEVTRIGLAYAGQEVSRLETETHDIPLHGVLTETGYRSFG